MDSTKASCHGDVVTKDVFEGTKDAGCNMGLSALYQHRAMGSTHPRGQQEDGSWAHLHHLHPSVTAP